MPAALARVSSDVIVEIIACLDVDSVLQIGCACTSLRKTTVLDRVWMPRLATCGLGRFPLDDDALAAFAALGTNARRLCLQCLPWRPRRGTVPDEESMFQSSWSWRPGWLPRRLRQAESSVDWIFVEIYVSRLVDDDSEDDSDGLEGRLPEHLRYVLPDANDQRYSESYIKRVITRKFIRLQNSLGFPEELVVPLDVDTHYERITQEVFEVRVMMQLGGILVPLADTCCMDGTDIKRHQQSFCHVDDEHRLRMDLHMVFDGSHFGHFALSWAVTADYQSAPHYLESGETALRDFQKYHATRFMSTIDHDDNEFQYSFACDYERDTQDPRIFDFTRKKPGPGGEQLALTLQGHCTALREAETRVARCRAAAAEAQQALESALNSRAAAYRLADEDFLEP